MSNISKASAILFAFGIVACASTMDVVQGLNPTGWTENGDKGKLIAISGPTDYAADAEGVRMADKAEFQGDMQPLVLDMPQTEAVLNELLNEVASQWPHTVPEPAKVKVYMSSQYMGLTYPDGTITISLGVLADLTNSVSPEGEDTSTIGVAESDEELLYLIAHEFSHYALGHHNKTDAMSKWISAGGSLTRSFNDIAIISEMRYRGGQSGSKGTLYIEDEGAVTANITKAIGTFDKLNSLTNAGLAPAWNRAQEDQADVLALDLIRAAGIEGTPYEDVFLRLQEHETLRARAQKVLSGSVQNFQANLLSESSLAGFLDGNAEATGTNLLDGLKSDLFRQGREQFNQFFGVTHRPPNVRKTGVQLYEMNAYPELGMTKEDFELMGLMPQVRSTTRLERIRETQEFQNAVKATRAYYASQNARSENDIALAEAEINKALAIPNFGRQSSILFEAGRVAESKGREPAQAINYYKSSELPEGFRRAASLQIKRSEYEAAELTIGQGTAKLNDEPFFLPQKIELAVAREQNDLVVKYANECRDNQSDDLVAACAAAQSGLDLEKLTPEQREALVKSERTSPVGSTILGIFGGSD